MLIAFSVAPTVTPTTDAEMSEAVAEAVRVVRASGLPCETNAMFTLVEGDWDEVMNVVKRATEAVMEVSPRVSLVLKADIRPGYSDRLKGKVASLEKHLSEDAAELTVDDTTQN
ncbi:thiamine-binding protein [Corynebacterium sp. 11A]|uniref:thiamine-binding protein n=1 Tax=Corynebacterium sp. 11A TaxID=2080510 RepID=UPI00124CED21|nr:thiamine-binding protein [Corynebacterium sp. 11A]